MAGTDSNLKGAVPETCWSLVMRAGEQKDGTGADALDELLRLYLPVLKAHLVYQFRVDAHTAEDITQSFVADKVIRKNLIGKADRSRGKFRNFLLKVFSNYVISRLRREKRRAESPDGPSNVNLDEHPDAVACSDDPSGAFAVRWAQQTVNEALRRMQTRCESQDLGKVWRVFELRIVGPVLGTGKPPPYEQLVRELGFESPSQASNALITAKRMFKRVLREVVRDTVDSERQTEVEVRELRGILADAGSIPEW